MNAFEIPIGSRQEGNKTMSDGMENGLSDNHWHMEGFRQRMTETEWRKILLGEYDTITCKGHVRKLVGNKIGFGVVEVSKVPLSEQD